MMKKTIAVLLAALMLAGLAACGGEPVQTAQTEENTPELEALSAEELCAFGASQREKLSAYRFETVCEIWGVSFDSTPASSSVTEIYVKTGYTYASSVDFTPGSALVPTVVLSYDRGTALLKNESGTFRAEGVSVSDFENARRSLSPYSAFQNWSGYPGLKKEGKTLSFEGDMIRTALLGTFPGNFTAERFSGTQTFGDGGFFAEETLSFTGDYCGNEATVTFRSRATALRDPDLSISVINPYGAVDVSDLRAPGLLQDAVDRLLTHDELQLSLSESRVSADGQLHTGSTLTMKKQNGSPDFLLEERRAVQENGEWIYSTRFVQYEGDLRREATFVQEIIGEEPATEEGQPAGEPEEPEDPVVETEVTGEEKIAAFEQTVREKLPQIADMKTLTLTESPDQVVFGFTLTDAFCRALLPEWTSAEGVTFETEGAAQIDAIKGELTFLSWTVKGSDGVELSFSLALDAVENVTIGTITPPEPVDPSSQHGDHDE